MPDAGISRRFGKFVHTAGISPGPARKVVAAVVARIQAVLDIVEVLDAVDAERDDVLDRHAAGHVRPYLHVAVFRRLDRRA